MKYLIVLTMLLLAGCTVTQPVVSEYRISPYIETIECSGEGCKKQSLKVRQVFSSSSLKSQKMRYAQDGFKEFEYTESEWAQSPNKAISAEIVKSVRASALFTRVNSFKSRSKTNLVLESNVEEFIQYFSEDETSSYVSISISMTLIDAKTAKGIATTTLSKRVDAKTNDAKGGVEALNAALTDILVQNNRWLNSVCQ